MLFRSTITAADDFSILQADQIDKLQLSVANNQRSIRVEIGKPIEVIVTPRDDPEVRGAALLIQEIIDSRRTFLRGVPGTNPRQQWLVALFMTLFAYSVVIISIFSVDRFDLTSADLSPQLTSIIFLPMTPVIVYVMARFFKSGFPCGIVVTKNRVDAPTCWEQNGTAVAVGLTTNAIVGLFFFLVGLVVAS